MYINSISGVKIFGVLLCGFLCLACGVRAAQDELLAADMGQSIVARVGTGSITRDQLMEQFGPAWYEITGQARAGQITATEVDKRLQDSWTKALEGAIKDEAFYQEAMRNFEATIQGYVDKQMAGARNGGGMTRKETEQRVRQIIDRQRHDIVQKMIEFNIKRAGGFDNLARMLKTRGISFDTWKQRILRKAYTYQFLMTRFQPMGNSVQPSPNKVLRYYRDNQDKFTEPGKVVFKHIFFDNKLHGGEQGAYQKATQAYTEIVKNQITFEDAVTKYSDDKVSAARGGVEDGVSTDAEREIWLEDLRQAAADQAPGKLGPVLISPRGCHITVLLRKDPGRVTPFKYAQKMILDKIENEKWQKLSDDYYRKLRSVMHIEIVHEKFPSEFSWDNLGKRNIPRRIGFDTSGLENGK